MGPWVPRHVQQDTPTGDDCAKVVKGQCILRLRDEPLRVGHLWVPPERYQFTTGYLQARIKFGAPPGAHGALWAQSLNTYVTPEDHEVDVVENFGNPQKVQCGFWRQEADGTKVQPMHDGVRLDATAWHVYGCDVREDSYTWTVDGKVVARFGAYGSDRPKFLVLSLLVDAWERPLLDMSLPHRMRVDWVRVTD
jgi:beta-glucanase (GH16 family)